MSLERSYKFYLPRACFVYIHQIHEKKLSEKFGHFVISSRLIRSLLFEFKCYFLFLSIVFTGSLVNIFSFGKVSFVHRLKHQRGLEVIDYVIMDRNHKGTKRLTWVRQV